ncbi:MAG: acyl-CoA thioester hydrolase [Paracoccaceae bacterium]|jgi:acyl-CoA thioester hydrolase
MPFVATHRAATESWECDQNAHLNVQFYNKRFDDAGRMLHALHGAAPATPRLRHVRYIRELRQDTSCLIDSAVLADGPHAGALVHILRNASGGDIAATCIDDIGDAASGLPRVSDADLPAPVSRGMTPGPWAPMDDAGLLAAGAAVFSSSMVVRPAQCDPDGRLAPWTLVSCFSNGATIAWDHLGVMSDWLTAHDLGRALVEMKLAIHALPGPGACLRQLTWPHNVNDRTVCLRHQITDLTTGALVAQGDLVGLVFDLGARRAVRVPPEAQARMAELLTRIA